jgi:hypothetical protein
MSKATEAEKHNKHTYFLQVDVGCLSAENKFHLILNSN